MIVIVDVVLEVILDDVIGFGDCLVLENLFFFYNIISYNYNYYDY